MKNLRAFSLIEVMIALGIIAALMTLGVFGVLRFRSYLELQNGYSDIVSFIRTIQNQSRNNIALFEDPVTSLPQTPEYYGILIQDNNYSIMSCNKIAAKYRCDTIQNEAKPSVYANVLLTLSSTCENKILAFERSTTDIVYFSGNLVTGAGGKTMHAADLLNTDECELLVSHNNHPSTRKITFNFLNNQLKFGN